MYKKKFYKQKSIHLNRCDFDQTNNIPFKHSFINKNQTIDKSSHSDYFEIKNTNIK